MIRLIEARLQDQFHLLFLVFFIVVSLGLILLQLRHLYYVLLTHKSAFVLRLLARLVLQIIWQYECVVLVSVFLNSGVLNWVIFDCAHQLLPRSILDSVVLKLHLWKVQLVWHQVLLMFVFKEPIQFVPGIHHCLLFIIRFGRHLHRHVLVIIPILVHWVKIFHSINWFAFRVELHYISSHRLRARA